MHCIHPVPLLCTNLVPWAQPNPPAWGEGGGHCWATSSHQASLWRHPSCSETNKKHELWLDLGWTAAFVNCISACLLYQLVCTPEYVYVLRKYGVVRGSRRPWPHHASSYYTKFQPPSNRKSNHNQTTYCTNQATIVLCTVNIPPRIPPFPRLIMFILAR